ncbi:hypothetical protein [Aeromicrobium sp. 179-A 4D2 NHS]|uniref:hypothetical protein n=1 Tax=Aeromicrobium sp. 179-A 4D2 NHS TaxID=3142375 RepID=UPI0039A3CEEA
MTVYMIVEEHRYFQNDIGGSTHNVTDSKLLTGRYFTNKNAAQKVCDDLTREATDAYADYVAQMKAVNADRTEAYHTEERRYGILKSAGEDVAPPEPINLIEILGFTDWSHLNYADVYVLTAHERDEADTEGAS